MVSKIYSAKKFYEKEKEHKLLKGVKDPKKKLHYDKKNKIYYEWVKHRTKDGEIYVKKYIKANDKVYSRGKEGVNLKNKKSDRARRAREGTEEEVKKYPMEFDGSF